MVMRVGGLASGMDIDSIVEKLMQAERIPYNKLEQTKQKQEWQRDAYRDVNTKLQAFSDFLFDEMYLQKDFMKTNVVSTNSAVSAVPTTAANDQSLTIDSVDQLARAGNAQGKIQEGTDGTTKLSDLGILGADESKEVIMKVLQTDGEMKEVKLNFTGSDTVDSLISKLKNDTGLNAFYDKQSGKISIATKATGVSNEEFEGYVSGTSTTSGGSGNVNLPVSGKASIFVEDGTGFLSKLGFGDSQFLAKGQNAELTINGAKIERQTNSFEIDGFKLTLNNTYSSNSGHPIDLTAKVDTDHVVDKIKKFVETYNGLIDSMNTLVKEPRYRDYAPLTEEQKKEMETKEIEAWEKKSKSGVLRNDSILNSSLNEMRMIMYSKGGGKQDVKAEGTKPAQNFINTLYEMGITTSDKMSDRGKLKIDEDKLREAIEKDPEQVFKTFSDTTAGNEGIARKLRESVQDTIREIERKAGKADSTNQSFQIGRQINQTDDRLDAWKKKLANIEARYWKQFTAMEEAINKANQQSASLFSGQMQ